jgi:hypothetical protein
MNAKTLANTLTSAEKRELVANMEAELLAAPSWRARCAAACALDSFNDHDGYQHANMRPADVRAFLISRE